MINLDTTGKSLEVVLGGAITTNQLPFSASWLDVDSTTLGVSTISETDGATNSATPVTLVAAPAASHSRSLKTLSIQNKDTATATVTVQLNNSATLRTLFNGTLAVGDMLFYEDGRGFYCVNSTGLFKTSAGIGPGGVSGDLQTNNGTGAFGAITPAAGIATWLATPSSANLITALTDELTIGTSPKALFASAFVSSTWTASLTAVTNVDAGTTSFVGGLYIQIGDRVIGGCVIQLDCTTNGSATELGVSLPVASNFAAAADAVGTMTSVGTTESFGVIADTVNHRLRFLGAATSASVQTVVAIFAYRVI